MSLVDLGKRLLEAAKQGLTDEVRTLMSNGAPFTTDWVRPFFEPASKLLNNVRLWIEEQVLDGTGTFLHAPIWSLQLGTSPLHFAAQNGHLATAEVLLRAGISRDARTKVDRTPLHVAAQEGHAEVVELLLRNGADIEAKDMVRQISGVELNASIQ